MAELLAKSAGAGIFPVSHGEMVLAELEVGTITSILPYRGQWDACSDALKAAHGMALPAPLRATGKAGARCLWMGKDQAFLIGPEPDSGLAKHASLTDQSDAWVVVDLSGQGAEAVLARLVPVDLRASVFKRGHTVRTLLQHMSVSITRLGEERFQIMAFRSMARTVAHDLGSAMALVAARADAG